MSTIAIVLSLATHVAYGAYDQPYNIPETEPPYGATPEEVTSALTDCDKNQVNINICAWDSYRNSLEALAKAVARVRDALADSKERLVRLDRAQKAWAESRNSDCYLEASAVDSGTMLWQVAYDCRTRLTNLRAVHLESVAKCAADWNNCSETQPE